MEAEAGSHVEASVVLKRTAIFVADRSPWSRLALQLSEGFFDYSMSLFFAHGEDRALVPDFPQVDWIISFKADLVLRRDELLRARRGAINIHPAPPRYRGVMTYRVALDNGDETYGVTIHFMEEIVDSGPIIDVIEFPILPGETAPALQERTGSYALLALQKLMYAIAGGQEIRGTDIAWGERLYRYADFPDDLGPDQKDWP